MKNSNCNTKVRTLTVMTALLLLTVLATASIAQQQIRSYNFNCSNISSNENTRAIINRVDTGYALAGYSYHPTCGISPFDWMWIQLRANGTVSRSNYYGTHGDDRCFSLVQDQGDRSYSLVGYMHEPAYGKPRATLVDVNNVGNFNYARRIHDTLASSYSQVIIDPAKTLGLTGYLEKSINNKIRNRILAAQYSSAGVLNWAYRYDSWVSATQQSPSTEEAVSICYQSAGNSYGLVAKTNFYSKSTTAWDPMIVKLNYSGAVIWKKVFRFNISNPNFYPSAVPTKIIPMTDGGFVVVGYTNMLLQSGSHILVFRVASNGSLMWSASYGTTSAFHYGNSIVLDGNNLVVAGYRRLGNANDAIMMKIPVTGGVPLWTRVWNPQQNNEFGQDIVLSNQSTASFGYALTGDVSTNSNDAFLWRTNSNGLLDSSACNSSVTLERVVNDVRLDSFLLARNQKYDKEYTPITVTANYRETLLCLGSFASPNDGETEYNNDNPVEEPVDYVLRQNFPNPFNPSTKISFSIPVDGNVTLSVYDISGRMVAELVNEFKQKGNHSVEFNAGNLSSGTYYYRISSNGFTDVRKMLLIK